MNKFNLRMLVVILVTGWAVTTLDLFARAADVQSLYSDLSDKACESVSKSEANYMIVQECPGILGFTLEKNTEDDRDSLTIVRDHQKQPLDFYGHVTDALNYLGEKAEWRVRDGHVYALIVRMYFTDPESSKPQQRLIVAKVQTSGSCVTQVINATQSPHANELARQMADASQGMKCLW